MAIETTEKCDHCGQDIDKVPERPGFPQMSWCYYRKGPQIVQDQAGKKHLIDRWQGQVYRREFCQGHGMLFNALINAFMEMDPRLMGVVTALAQDNEASYREQVSSVIKQFQDFQKAEQEKVPKA